MKKLKFNHQLAQLISEGRKTSTWRMFDDKDLTVNDVVELIDKIQPNQPQTWKIIGTARINRVVEKRLGDISSEDYEGGQNSESVEDRIQTYRKYYGTNVSLETPIKIISFDFMPIVPKSTDMVNQMEPSSHRVIVYADGGSRGNPGPSACGYIIMNQHEEVLVDKGLYLGITTNNQAEYQGLKLGLEEAHRMGAREVSVRLDSLLVINQMKGVFKVKNRDLWAVHDAIKELVKQFDKISFTHVPRELNKLADAAVNRVLDEAAQQRR